MNLEIKYIKVVIERHKTATVFCYTNLDNPLWPFDHNLVLKFDCPVSTVEKYIKDNFKDVRSDIIDAR